MQVCATHRGLLYIRITSCSVIHLCPGICILSLILPSRLLPSLHPFVTHRLYRSQFPLSSFPAYNQTPLYFANALIQNLPNPRTALLDLDFLSTTSPRATAHHWNSQTGTYSIFKQWHRSRTRFETTIVPVRSPASAYTITPVSCDQSLREGMGHGERDSSVKRSSRGGIITQSVLYASGIFIHPRSPFLLLSQYPPHHVEVDPGTPSSYQQKGSEHWLANNYWDSFIWSMVSRHFILTDCIPRQRQNLGSEGERGCPST